jgi:hypothetical protein
LASLETWVKEVAAITFNIVVGWLGMIEMMVMVASRKKAEADRGSR